MYLMQAYSLTYVALPFSINSFSRFSYYLGTTWLVPIDESCINLTMYIVIFFMLHSHDSIPLSKLTRDIMIKTFKKD